MPLQDYMGDMSNCTRCSACKFVPMSRIKGLERANVCPSISRYDFHTFSAGGRMAMGVALLKNKLGFTDKLRAAIYDCQMCGACDVSCKFGMDMDVMEPLYALRAHAVENGQVRPALAGLINSLNKQGTMVPGARAKRGDWAKGQDVKTLGSDFFTILYHAGCRACYDSALGKIARTNIKLLQKANVDVGIAGDIESCCGGRAYQMGYQADFLKQAEANMKKIRQAGIKVLLTGCAECYQALKVLYDKFDFKGDLEVLHTVEYFDRLIKEGKLKPSKKVYMKVTYHDPCHLGRLSESWTHWRGEPIPGHIRIFNPPKQWRRGESGVYEPPRSVIKSILGVELVEMDRIKEYAWCCGAGGGVKESNPDFARWTAAERVAEAELTGAQAIVTACPGCESLFRETLQGSSKSIQILDITELLETAI